MENILEAVEEIEVVVEPYKVYARANELKKVEKIFSTCFENAQEGDVLVKEGFGDEFVHVGYYQIFDENGCFNYKIVEKENDDDIIEVMEETTSEEKQAEIAARPEPPLTEMEQLRLEVDQATGDISVVFEAITETGAKAQATTEDVAVMFEAITEVSAASESTQLEVAEVVNSVAETEIKVTSTSGDVEAMATGMFEMEARILALEEGLKTAIAALDK